MPNVRSLSKAIIFPILRPIWQVVSRRIDSRIAPLDKALKATESRLESLELAWKQNISEFLNAVGTVPAFAYELAHNHKTINNIIQRLENIDSTERERGKEIKMIQQQIEDVFSLVRETRSSISSIRNDIGTIQERIATAVEWQKFSAAVQQDIPEEIGNLRRRFDQTLTRLDNADGSTRAIWDRIELVRREIQNPRIVAREKVAAALQRRLLRLNLGCGHLALSEYINVDMRELPGVDIVADVGHLPFERASLDEIFSAHLLEHFPQEKMNRQLLPYWYSLLRPGGVFRAITPDAKAMLSAAASGAYEFGEFREAVFGSQDYIGDYHYNLFTPCSLSQLLQAAGFSRVRVPVTARRNGKCFEFEVIAHRPE